MGMDCFNITKAKCENCGRRDCRHQSWFACAAAHMRQAQSDMNDSLSYAARLINQQPTEWAKQYQQQAVLGSSAGQIQWTPQSATGLSYWMNATGPMNAQATAHSNMGLFNVQPQTYEQWRGPWSEVDQMIFELRQRVENFRL